MGGTFWGFIRKSALEKGAYFFWKASFLDIFRFHVEIAGSVS